MCFDGVPLYYAKGKNPPKCLKFGTHEERFNFAREAIQQLRTNCPEALVSGLVRVDIMVDDNGDMVLNEFESLEAGHQSATRNSFNYASLCNKMNNYYYFMLLAFIDEILKKN